LNLKKQKIEQVNSPKVNVKKSVSIDNLDDFDKELAELDVGIDSGDVDVEDFDKELNEIEELMNN